MFFSILLSGRQVKNEFLSPPQRQSLSLFSATTEKASSVKRERQTDTDRQTETERDRQSANITHDLHAEQTDRAMGSKLEGHRLTCRLLGEACWVLPASQKAGFATWWCPVGCVRFSRICGLSDHCVCFAYRRGIGPT